MALIAAMQTNDKNNEWLVSVQDLSTWDMENGVLAVGEDGNEDTVITSVQYSF